ncbi:MAG: hypothetical protein R3284_04135 [Rubricoccaceae bacterium]|nr:hypothetical protein [Rubricoccaceae bacterium]
MTRRLLSILFLAGLLPFWGCDSNSDPGSQNYTRVVITEVNIEAWPIREPGGDRWDSFPTADPDLYWVLVDSGGQLLHTTEDDDAPNVGDNDIGPQWITNLQFTGFNRTLKFEIWDSDSDEDDYMGETETFSLQTFADQGYRTFASLENGDGSVIVTIRLRWER